ncbi:transposase [Ectothiorhodospiraceae bacterium 2226]|nr:transposase [Ectothiorhodospiraceae bacterium 2226]
MARPLRIEYPGAWYHVMNRGAGRKRVFKTDAQREYFLQLLAATAERYRAEWHAYCLMDNHYHLLLRTPEGNLQRVMRHVNGLYTQFFNRAERRDGALFRGRYRAVLVDADAHWLELSRYIHRNPLEAGMVRDLDDYPWSSYRAYVGLEPRPPCLRTDDVLKAIGARDRQRRYRAFVAGDTDEALRAYYEQRSGSGILGDEAFRARVLAGKAPDPDRPAVRAAQVRPSVDEIVAAVCRRMGVDEQEVWVGRRGRAVRTPARPLAMYLCQEVGGLTLAEIAERFGLSGYAGAGSSVRRIRGLLQNDAGLRKVAERVRRDLETGATGG